MKGVIEPNTFKKGVLKHQLKHRFAVPQKNIDNEKNYVYEKRADERHCCWQYRSFKLSANFYNRSLSYTRMSLVLLKDNEIPPL